MPLLTSYQLTYSTSEKTLFKDISFAIEEGDQIGLVGPNGAGKSTLLKIIAGILTPDKGQITANRGLRIGYLTQTPTFNPDETILDSLVNSSTSDDPWSSAFEWMAKLDLVQFPEDQKVRELSGGWMKRVALARELIKTPDLLILDEPTNHLDVKSILWLEDFLKRQVKSYLVVTHDRLFLQRIANRIFDLDKRYANGLLVSNGGYTQYLESKQDLLAARQKLESVMKNTLRRESEWLARGAKARQTKQKARQESAHQLKDDVAELSEKNKVRKLDLEFTASQKNAKKLMELEGVNIGYENGQVLIENLDLIVRSRDRIALLGDNGAGKTSLIRVLIERQAPLQGKVKTYEKLQVAYFEQTRDTLNYELSVLKNLCPEGDYVSFQGSFVHVRSYLDRFHFFGSQADLPVGKLSGGEQARLRIAQMMLQQAQVLILDEPTNDLDVDTLDVLEDALKQFPGAVILVTHDRYFMDQVADRILALPEINADDKKIYEFADYFQWEAWKEDKRSVDVVALSSSSNLSVNPAAANLDKKSTSNNVTNKKLSFKEKFELENMESNIAAKESELTKLQAELSEPSTQVNAKKLIEISEKVAQLETEIQRMYDRWSELSGS